jgi:phage terminase large subunit-like protein
MMQGIDIVRWAQSPVGFYTDRWYNAEAGEWVLEPKPIKLAPYHADILRHCFTPDERGRLPYDVIGWCEPAKSGKSAIAALAAQFMALHGEKNSAVVLASNKQNQAASIMYRSLTDSLRYNPALRISPNRYEVELPSGTTVRAIPSNSRGEAGARFSLALFDELWAYVYTDAERLWSEFKTDPTRQHSLKLAVGYAGYAGESDLWLDVLETGTKKGKPVPELEHISDGRGQPACWVNGRHFVFWSHTTRQPWQTPEWKASLQASLMAGEYLRMVECDFAASAETFIEEAWWDACFDPKLPPLRPGDSTPLVVAVDASQVHDWTAIVACSRHPERHDHVAVRFVRAWNPKTQPGGFIDHERTIIPTVRWLFENFNIVQCTYDIYQLAATMQALRREGLGWFREFPQGDGTKAQPGRTIADARLRHMIVHRELWHNGDPVLKAHIMASAARVTGESKLRLVKKGRDPIDLAVALSMSAAEAARLNI